MPRRASSSVCPRRAPPIPVRRRKAPQQKKKPRRPEKGRTRKNREKENIESARGLLDIFRFIQQKKNEPTFINSFLVGEGGFAFLRKSRAGCGMPPAYRQEPAFES